MSFQTNIGVLYATLTSDLCSSGLLTERFGPASTLNDIRVEQPSRVVAGYRLLHCFISKREGGDTRELEADARQRFARNIEHARSINHKLKLLRYPNAFRAKLGERQGRDSLHFHEHRLDGDCGFHHQNYLGRDYSLILDDVIATAAFEIHRAFDGYVDGETVKTCVNYDTVLEGIGLGSGSNVGAQGCTLVGKLTLKPISYSNTRCLNLIRSMFSESSLEFLFRRAGARECPGGNITFVPKTVKTMRVIRVEPTCEMLLQKGIASVMRRVLKERFSCDLSSQPDLNRRYAKEGSIDPSLCVTIDLSDASDCITDELVKCLIPFYPWLELSRSRHGADDLCSDEYLPIFCTMGNDWTFPLQTLIFLAIARATSAICGDSFPPQVFGDDIILGTKSASAFINVLIDLGFKPNRSKTFTDPYYPVRESCGVDCFKGYDIRPVYLKRFDTLADVFHIYNSLTIWGANHKCELVETRKFLLSLIPKRHRYHVPSYEATTAGLYVPTSDFTLSFDKDGHEGISYVKYAARSKVISVERLIKLLGPAAAYVALLHGSLRTPDYTVGIGKKPTAKHQDPFVTKQTKCAYEFTLVRSNGRADNCSDAAICLTSRDVGLRWVEYPLGLSLEGRIYWTYMCLLH